MIWLIRSLIESRFFYPAMIIVFGVLCYVEYFNIQREMAEKQELLELRRFKIETLERTSS